MLKYTKADITQLSDGLYAGVRPHLAWKFYLNTFNDCLCLTLLLLFEVFGSNILKLPQCHLMWMLSWRLWIIFMFSFPWLRVFELKFALMSQIPSSVYNFFLELPLGLNRFWANLVKYLPWKMWITFFVSLIINDLEHWVRNYSESQKKKKLLLLHFLGE